MTSRGNLVKISLSCESVLSAHRKIPHQLLLWLYLPFS